ncbi:MAG: DHH family phosphoesterase [Candidatus Hodarchaeales archaeon]|jgi:nanoRNase/pAp phosphatase (c-di-AMP/oligoRNAs hydrolase)
MKRVFTTDVKKFIKHLKSIEGEIVILSHKNTDLDGYAAALGLKLLIETLNSNVNVHIVFHSLKSVTKAVIREFNLPVVRTEKQFHKTLPDTQKTLHVFLVDCNIPSTTGYKELEGFSVFKTKNIIDHHEFHPMGKKYSDYYICEPDFSSASEIILNLLLKYEVKLGNKIATALLSGIIYDSRRFMESDSELFWLVAELLEEINLDYRRIINSLRIESTRSEKIARLKACQRMNYREIHGFFIASTFIKSFEASAARSILNLGVDLVYAVAVTQYETRISFRASNQFIKKLGVNLGKDIAEVVSKQYGGTGSGHTRAAGVNIPQLLDEKKIILEIDTYIERMIESKKSILGTN